MAIPSLAKLAPNDPRVEHHTTKVRGRNYHYTLARPPPSSTPPRATVLLLHGFPDFGFGWRNQIPALAAQGFQVLTPDLLGYGGTDAPAEVAPYAVRNQSDDLVALVDAAATADILAPTVEKRVVLGGHDWGGYLAWRFAEWHPDRIAAVFVVCTPYNPPREDYMDLPTMTRLLPNFGYMNQLASEAVVAQATDPTTGRPDRAVIRDLLNVIYGGGAAAGVPAFSVDAGYDFGRVGGLPTTPLLSDAELDHYADQFARNGMRGPTNWYRTRRENYDDELELIRRQREAASRKGAASFKIKTPSLFIGAAKDLALPPFMTDGMDAHFENLTHTQVDTSHWALVEATNEVNRLILGFLDEALTSKAAI